MKTSEVKKRLKEERLVDDAEIFAYGSRRTKTILDDGTEVRNRENVLLAVNNDKVSVLRVNEDNDYTDLIFSANARDLKEIIFVSLGFLRRQKRLLFKYPDWNEKYGFSFYGYFNKARGYFKKIIKETRGN